MHRGDADHHSERSVISAGVADGVEVRADDERVRAGGVALVAPAQVADVVVPHDHARLPHPFRHLVVRALHRLACELTGQPVWFLADRTEDVEPLHGRLG